jgi:predicted cupin superfamily sugar epimerase
LTRPTVADLIRRLDLKPLPREGGFYAETYRAREIVPAGALPPRYGADRAHATAILYLLTPESHSALHRLRSDEVYHFCLGDPVQMLNLGSDGTGEVVILGQDLAAGQRLQHSVLRGVWQGCRVLHGGTYALLGTTVAPGFEAEDFELGDARVLAAAYPAFAGLIRTLDTEKGAGE